MTEDEFTAVVEKNMGRFVGIVAKYLNLQPADAEDVVQRALLRAWQRCETCRAQVEFEKWIIACVINEGLDHIKACKRYQRRLTRATQAKQMAPGNRSQTLIPL